MTHENFKIIEYEFPDPNPIRWKRLLLNHLEYLFLNERLEIIGSVNDPWNPGQENATNNSVQGVQSGSFQMLFYKFPDYYKNRKFRFSAEIIYDDLN